MTESMLELIQPHTIEDFQYVVPERTQNPISFLSKKEREVLPRSGTTRFESEYLSSDIATLTPNMYEIPSSFSVAKTLAPGTVGLGGKCQRFHNWKKCVGPSPNTYNVCSFPTPVKPCKVPFNSSTERLPLAMSITPGPGTYDATSTERNWRIPFRYSFTGKKIMVPAVEIKCCSINQDRCKECNMEPDGDYWHLNNTEFLCRTCKALKKPSETNNYKKIRDCTFMHRHERTTAKIHLMERKELVKFQQREAYLSQYFK